MYKLKLTALLILLTLGANTQAEEGKLILGQTRVFQGPDCQMNEKLSEKQINNDTESDAHQKCDNTGQETELVRVSTQIDKVETCSLGKGGSTVYQMIYKCRARLNPGSLFEGQTASLQSEASVKDIGLPFVFSACLHFKIMGLTHKDVFPFDNLRTLVAHLEVTSYLETGILKPELISTEGGSAVQYRRTAPGFRKDGINIRSLIPSQSINDLISADLGKSPTTGFNYTIQISTVDCTN